MPTPTGTRRHVIKSRRLHLWIETLEPRLNLANVIWDGGPTGTDTSWHVPANWQGDILPSADDDVQIGAGFADLTISVSSGVSIKSMNVAAALRISSGTFSLGNSESSVSELALSGGAFVPTGALTVTESFSWTGGYIGGAGTTTLAASAAGSISGEDIKGIQGTLENAGSLTLDNSAVAFGYQSQTAGLMRNLAGGTFVFSGAGGFSVYGVNPDHRFVNQGVFQHIGAGTTTFTSVAFDNSGTIDVQEGTLALGGGGNFTGDYAIEGAGPTRLTAGTFTLADATGTGGGVLEVAGGTLTATGESTVSKLAVSSGVLSPAGSIEVTNGFSWTGGSLSGAGTTTLASTATGSISGAASKYMEGVLENAGLLTLENSSVLFGYPNQTVGLIRNLAGGTFVASGGGGFSIYGGNPGHRFVNQGVFRHIGSDTTTFTGVAVDNSGTIDVQEGTLALGGGGSSAVFDAQSYLSLPLGSDIELPGGLVGNTTNAAQFSPLAAVSLRGGIAEVPSFLEAMGRDVGNTPTGLTPNFSFAALRLSSGWFRLIDISDNFAGDGAEAIYTDTLIVPVGSTLDLNGLNIYARAAQLDGVIVGGTVQILTDGGTLLLNAPTSGTISSGGEADEWTFFGRAGRAITLFANPGGGTALRPAAPTLRQVNVEVFAPDGSQLTSGSSVTPGEVVALAGVSLPATGQYRVRIRTAPAQPSGVGNYLLSVFDATVDVNPLVFNQTSIGALETGYCVDRWVFTANENQQVRFDLINTNSQRIRFKLTGPNGWVGFTDQSTDSDPTTLPSDGQYTLEAYGDGTRPVNYAFRLEELNPTIISLGTAHAGTLVDSGHAHLFKFELAEGNPLLVAFDAGAGNDVRTEVYLRREAPPDRRTFDFSSKQPAADQSILASLAGPGTWYMLVYGAHIPAALDYTLRVASGPLLLAGITPDRYSADDIVEIGIRGSGFLPGAQINLVDIDGNQREASQVSIDAFDRATATFDLTAVPEGTYSLVVELPDGAVDSLPAAFTVLPVGAAQLETHLHLPAVFGRHMPATIIVEYANTGSAAMPAPILTLQSGDPDGSLRPLLTLDQTLLGQGLWTSALPPGFSNSIQLYASGTRTGLLMPGERVRVPVYYAGLQQPWVDSQVQLELRVHEAGSTAAIDWNQLKPALKPGSLTNDVWNAVFANLISQIGPTWGDYVKMLAENARYLDRLGRKVADAGELFHFEVQQATGFTPISVVAAAIDAAVPTPGPPLELSRTFGNSIAERHRDGMFGRGWSDAWDYSIDELVYYQASAPTRHEAVQVTIHTPGGGVRTFLADRRNPNKFFSQPGDTGQFVRTAEFRYDIRDVFPPTETDDYGRFIYELREADGTVLRFIGQGFVVGNPNAVLELDEGYLDSVADANGNAITLTYDSVWGADRLVSLSHSSGSSLAFQYFPTGRVSSVTDSFHRVTTYGYDESGTHLLSATGPAGTTTYSYLTGTNLAREHALTSVTDSSGVTQHYEYDERGRLASMYLDGGEGRVDLAFDSTGGVTISGALGGSSKLFIDHDGLVARSEDGVEGYTLYAYDNSGQLVRQTDALGRSRSFVWTKSGALHALTDELGNTTTFETKGPRSLPSSFTDARGNTVAFDYDPAGNQTGTIYPDGSTERIVYDALGNPTSFTNRRGQTIGLTYNAAGLVTQRTTPGESPVSYGYDDRNRLVSVTDDSGSIAFDYDDADNLTHVDYPNGRWLSYQYDAAGRRTRMEDNSGFVVTYAYDVASRLHQLRDGNDALIVAYAYDPAGRVEREDKGNGTWTLNTYDAAGHVESIVHHAPSGDVNSRFDYTYDALGRQVGMETLDGVWSYNYDFTGQLVRAVFTSTNPLIADQDLNYEYDASGNRVRTVLNGDVTEYATNQLNQYTSADAATFVYDRDGNLIEEHRLDGTQRYTYNAVNQLVRVVTPEATWQYEYDALGNREAVIHDGQRTEFLLDPTGIADVIGEYDQVGTRTVSYTHGFGLEGAVFAAVQRYYDFDALGSTTGVSEPDGAYANRYAYQPFGERLLAAEATRNQYQFHGQFGVTAENYGLHSMRARFYHPGDGRFTSVDPIGLVGGDVNFYRFVGNDPVSFVDPVGLQSYDPLEAARRWREDDDQCKNGCIKAPNELDNHFRRLDKEAFERERDFKANAAINVGCTLVGLALPEIGAVVFSGVSGGCGFIPDFGNVPGDTPVPPGGLAANGDSKAAQAVDPNEKFGAAGYGAAGFIPQTATIPYVIHFENLGPGSIPTPTQPATAPAQRVEVTDRLSTDLDWSTLRFTAAGFGDTVISVPDDAQYFFTTVSMTFNEDNFDVEVELSFDAATGRVRAVFQSVDPNTSLPPEVLTGFLPPEDGTHRGKGFISFTVQPKSDLPTGTELRNVALISFDGQTIIATNQIDPQNASAGTDPAKEALNTIDAGTPTSTVSALPSLVPASRFLVRWSATDDAGGSGVATYDIYFRDNGGPVVLWRDDTILTHDTFVGAAGHAYAFFSVATDNVGNRQPVPASPNTSTTVSLLEGDFDANGSVGLSDLANLQAGLGALDATAIARIDLNGDGVLNRADVAVFATRFGRTLPSPSPAPSPVAVDLAIDGDYASPIAQHAAPSAIVRATRSLRTAQAATRPAEIADKLGLHGDTPRYGHRSNSSTLRAVRRQFGGVSNSVISLVAHHRHLDRDG